MLLEALWTQATPATAGVLSLELIRHYAREITGKSRPHLTAVHTPRTQRAMGISTLIYYNPKVTAFRAGSIHSIRRDPPVTAPFPSRWLPALVLGLVFCLPATAFAQPYLAIPQSSRNSVDIVSTATNALLAELPIGVDPENVVMSPTDPDLAYVGGISSVSGTVSSSVTEINLATAGIVQVFTLQSATSNIALGAMAIAPNGETLYFINPDTGTLYALHLGTGSVATISNYGVGTAPTAIAAGLTGLHLYVCLSGDNTLSVIDLASGEISTLTLPDAFDPLALALSPAGTRLYVANSGDNTIDVLDIRTGTFLPSLTVPGFPTALAVSPNGQTLYVAQPTEQGVVTVIPLANPSQEVSVSVGQAPATLALSPDGTRLYVLDANAAELSILDTATNQLVSTLNLSNAAAFSGSFSGNGDIVASPATFTTPENTPLSANVNAADTQNRTLSYLVATPPSHGTLSLDSGTGSFTYTPQSGYVGEDRFAFLAEASSGPGAPTTPLSAPAAVQICDLSHPPSLGQIPATVIPTGATSVIAFTPNIGCDLDYTASSSNPSVIPDSGITFGGLGLNRTINLEAPGTAGISNIHLVATAPNQTSAAETFQVTVAQAPVINGLVGPYGITVSSSVGPYPFTVTGTNPITLTVSSDDPGILPASGVKLAGTGTDRTITMTPIPNQLGTAIVTVTATDGNGLTSSVSFDVEVVQNASSAIDPTSLLFLLLLGLGGAFLQRRRRA